MDENVPYTFTNDFVLRTALKPLEFLAGILNKKTITDEELKKLISDELIAEALLIASRGFFEEVQRWLNGELNEKKIKKLKFSLLRYLIRLSSRATPFGLFAGVSSGKWGSVTKIQIKNKESYVKHSRLDMALMIELCNIIGQDRHIRSSLLFYPNSSLYEIGEYLRYVEYKYEGTNKIHQIVSVENNEALQIILDTSKKGASIIDLTDNLRIAGYPEPDISDFVMKVIQEQMIVSQLEPNVTGGDYLDRVIKLLRNSQIVADSQINHGLLLDLKYNLRDIDELPPGSGLHLLKFFYKKISDLKLDQKYKHYLHIDLYKPVIECSLKASIQKEIFQGLKALNKLTAASVSENLKGFKNSFEKRYGDKEIPLSHALDTDIGIPYGQEMKNGFHYPFFEDIPAPLRPSQKSISFTKVDSLMMSKLCEIFRDQKQVLEITENDLKDLEENWNDLPDSMSGLFRLYTKDGDLNSPLIFMPFMGGATAAALLGRFSNFMDIEQQVTHITKKEASLHPSAIVAELVHLPDNRTANVLLRSAVRDFEIAYLARPSVNGRYKIRMKDLRVSVKNNQIVLRSAKHKKEILPRLSTAHNFTSRSLPVYRFLCDLQFQGKRPGIGFSWGEAFRDIPFLPRVVYKNLIFSFARWHFKKSEFSEILKSKDEQSQIEEFAKFRERHCIPQSVVLKEGDKELFLDFENSEMIKLFFHLAGRRNHMEFNECLFNKSNCIVASDEGSYVNEFVFSIIRND